VDVYRRKYLVSAGGALVTLTGGTAVVRETRADILADGELTRGRGEPAKVERAIVRDSVEYLEPTDEVRENGHTDPFGEWARRECGEVGAEAVVSVVERRIDGPVEGVGSGVQYLLFGPVVTVDHTVTQERDGSVASEPNIPLDRLVSVAPPTMTVTVALDGREYTAELPVGVGHAEVSPDRSRGSGPDRGPGATLPPARGF